MSATGGSIPRPRPRIPRGLAGPEDGWSVRTQLLVIVVGVMVVFAGVFSYVAAVTLRDARHRATRDATFQAGLGARAVADALAQGGTAMAGLAGELDVAALVAHPSGCTLSFAPLGVFPTGHIDLAMPDGRVLCSSIAAKGAPRGTTHAGASWVASPATARAPGVTGLFTDRLTGKSAIAITAPIVGRAGRLRALAVLVLPVGDLRDGLAAMYGGPQQFAFAVTDGAGQRLSGSDHQAGAAASDGLAGADRIGGWRPVPGLGWRVYASQPTRAALGPTRAILAKEAGLAGVAFLVMLVLLAVVNRRIAGPLRRLTSAAVQAGRRMTQAPLPAAGPSELRRLADEFNRMVAARDTYEAELSTAHETLQRHAMELERANADLQVFAHSTSHDLAEPLRVITNYAQLLKRKYQHRLDPDADLAIEFVVEGTTRMHSLIDGVLTHAQATHGQQARAPVDVTVVVEEVLHSLQLPIEEAHAQIEVGPLPRLEADRDQLGQVVQNLVANALHYRSDQPPRITISATRVEDGWRLSVADNGIGIDPAHRDRVFQMFQRLNRREDYPGTGVGLAICQRIVHRHGGRIWVEPGPQGGSVFHFTIPDALPPSVRHPLAPDPAAMTTPRAH